MLKNRLLELSVVTVVLLLVSGVLWLTNTDHAVASTILGGKKLSPLGMRFWPAGDGFPWKTLYYIAPYPAIVLALTALGLLVSGFFIGSIAFWRKKAIFVLLFLALGPGLVVNVILKDQLGRARPREVVEFGGTFAYTQMWQPGNAGKNSSFPSGHASIAFFAIAPWFLLRDSHRKTAAGFLLLGLTFGTLVGTARILQGGHFVSDVIWAGGLVYLIGGGLALLMGFARKQIAGQLSA